MKKISIIAEDIISSKKTWTEKEWKTYRRQHPGTRIKPKFRHYKDTGTGKDLTEDVVKDKIVEFRNDQKKNSINKSLLKEFIKGWYDFDNNFRQIEIIKSIYSKNPHFRYNGTAYRIVENIDEKPNISDVSSWSKSQKDMVKLMNVIPENWKGWSVSAKVDAIDLGSIASFLINNGYNDTWLKDIIDVNEVVPVIVGKLKKESNINGKK